MGCGASTPAADQGQKMIEMPKPEKVDHGLDDFDKPAPNAVKRGGGGPGDDVTLVTTPRAPTLAWRVPSSRSARRRP